MAKIQQLSSFPAEDGHIESILIGCQIVKLSFQTWDSRQLVIIYDNVQTLTSSHAVYGDIYDYTVKQLSDDLKKYEYYDADECLVLSIQAKSVKIFEVGKNAILNAALFDIDFNYIGNQNL